MTMMNDDNAVFIQHCILNTTRAQGKGGYCSYNEHSSLDSPNTDDVI